MVRYEALVTRLRAGETVMIDGGTGTECERRGIPQLENAWNGGGAISHPDIVRAIHQDYLEHGAELIISNTFATSLHALQAADKGNQFDEYNRAAVELAIEARNASNRPNALVAGGISYWSWTGHHPPLSEIEASSAQQAVVMRDAGADLLMLEMMIDIDRMLTTLAAAQTSGLPVWVGISCVPNSDAVMTLWNGEPLVDAVAALADSNVPLLSIMHTDVKYVEACLDILQDHWHGMTGVYAHSGTSVDGKWVFHDTISPKDYTEYCQSWMKRDIHVIGGCCGIRPDHMEHLAGALHRHG